ncbi:MAG: DEAD/DEAH box helicase [Desulfovibrio sp.]|nr:DEAD/DEAH box helicase [Desulfovibrio sp.]
MTSETSKNNRDSGKGGNFLPSIETNPGNLPAVSLHDLPPKLREACGRAGWTSLTPVQELAIPLILEGKDIMVQSRTGSGKTGTYLLPLLESIDPSLKKPQALILVPTRELALQVETEAKILFGGTGVGACAMYGGVGYDRQLAALRQGCQVVVGTPGRILDHLARKTLVFERMRNLIFDEADRMLSIGFYPDLQQIAAYLPEDRQTTLFSATYPPYVMQLAAEFMKDPIMLTLSRDEVHVAAVEHLFARVKNSDKDRALVRFLETENPSSAIIFCNTKAEVRHVAEELRRLGFSAEALTSDLSQRERETALARARQGKVKYLVATDVAARGIDIPALSHVFLMQPPKDRESYIHRAGRTGRAGAAGTVICLVDPRERMDLERIGKFYKIDFHEIKVPDEEDIANTICSRLDTLLEARMRSLTDLERARVERYKPIAKRIIANLDASDEQSIELLSLLLDDYYRLGRQENRFPITAKAPRVIIPREKPRRLRPAPFARKKTPSRPYDGKRAKGGDKS